VRINGQTQKTDQSPDS